MKTLHIFRTGEFTPMEGTTLKFSDDDLKAVAENYDPAVSQAPIVIGHPKMNAPAWGWVTSVSQDAKGLHAAADQVDASFATAVNEGRYKKISASFFTPKSPNNPTPGKYYLRHVGFLGAVAPAVKGLTPPEFADKEVSFAEDDEVVTVEFAQPRSWTFGTIAELFSSVRDYLIEQVGTDDANKVIAPYLVDKIRRGDDESVPAFSDPAETPPTTPDPSDTPDKQEVKDMTTEKDAAELAAEREKLDAAKKAQDEREAAFAQREREADAQTFIAELGDKVLPAEVDGLVSFMAGLRDDDTVSFGDGDKKTTKPALEFFKDFLKARPAPVDFSERTDGSKGFETTASFAAPGGFEVNKDKLAIDSRARALQAQNPDMSYLDAVKQAEAG